jgi:hypothetical protein
VFSPNEALPAPTTTILVGRVICPSSWIACMKL